MADFLSFLSSECLAIVAFVNEIGEPNASVSEENIKIATYLNIH
jgi:hypothetical protein